MLFMNDQFDSLDANLLTEEVECFIYVSVLFFQVYFCFVNICSVPNRTYIHFSSQFSLFQLPFLHSVYRCYYISLNVLNANKIKACPKIEPRLSHGAWRI